MARTFNSMRPVQNGFECTAGPDDAGRRLDRVLRVLLKDRSLPEIYSALRKGRIRVNGQKANQDRRLEEGDRIFLHASLAGEGGTSPPGPIGGGLDSIADILILATYDLLFVNKPRGELSQGPYGLEPRIRRALAARSAESLSFVPGPLHRLDRNTTGVLAFPGSAAGARAFSSLIRERRVVKRYIALVDGEASEGARWRDGIVRDEATMTSSVSAEGAEAIADMRPLLAYGGRSLVQVLLHTGLTHQIRVQSASRGLPLSGDAKYGGGAFPGGYILHALSLEFPEPPFADLPRFVTAPLPGDVRLRLAALFGEAALDSALEAAQGA
jgi:23S rRNA pseudouridine955/2504/2580 synthase